MLKALSNAGLSAALLTLVSAPSYASETDHSHPASHRAPIGVMGDHIHGEGEWMASYRYSSMQMDGNRDGSRNLSPQQVLSNFMVTPLDMQMEMHMVSLMYGATDRLSLMTMVPYVKKSMRHLTRTGATFTTKTDGLGDIKLGGVYDILGTANQHDPSDHSSAGFLLNVGLSLPTGSVDKRGNTPAGANSKLPYPMQLGSGTLDPIIGLTYSENRHGWSWGTQANTTLRFGHNSEGYRLGNEVVASSWVVKDITDYAGLSLRLEGRAWGDIKGTDGDLNPRMIPTARTDLRGGKRVDALLGVNLYQSQGVLAGHRFAAEFGLPLYQHLDGPQLETDHRLTLGWQWLL